MCFMCPTKGIVLSRHSSFGPLSLSKVSDDAPVHDHIEAEYTTGDSSANHYGTKETMWAFREVKAL